MCACLRHIVYLLGALVMFTSSSRGGAEYVYVRKVIDSGDKAIVIRRNGEAYLIEKGMGCMSLWRYEDKAVIISSPGLFLGVGSRLIIPELDQDCRIWDSQDLGDLDQSIPSLPADCEEGHWIQEVSRDGAVVLLEDNSVWLVDSIDQIYTTLWLPTEDILVCAGFILNTGNGEKVGVTRVR